MMFLKHIGRYFRMLGGMFYRPENPRMYWYELVRQMNDIGSSSVPIVILICGFIGAVTAVQMSYQLVSLGAIPTHYISYIVRDSLLLELSPTFACLVLAGKVGANIATELGTMRVKEQIDALRIMGVHTDSYLIGPKIVAALIMIPALVIIGAVLGMVGGWIAGQIGGFIGTDAYMEGLSVYPVPGHAVTMLIKSLIFGFILTSVCAYKGYYVKGGALEIGKASTQAVVYSSILILVADLFVVLFTV